MRDHGYYQVKVLQTNNAWVGWATKPPNHAPPHIHLFFRMWRLRDKIWIMIMKTLCPTIIGNHSSKLQRKQENEASSQIAQDSKSEGQKAIQDDWYKRACSDDITKSQKGPCPPSEERNAWTMLFSVSPSSAARVSHNGFPVSLCGKSVKRWDFNSKSRWLSWVHFLKAAFNTEAYQGTGNYWTSQFVRE